jgi:hypothetical protein
MPFIVNSIPRYVAGTGGFNGIAVRVYRSTDQSIPVDDLGVDISFDGERFDTDNMWDISNPTRLTINTTGIYHIFANVEFEAGGFSYTSKSIFVYRHIASPHSDDIIGARRFQASTSNSSILNLTMAWYLVAGDYLHLKAHHNHTIERSVKKSVDGIYSPEFGAYWIGDIS